jgi:hypothetical protein
MGLRHRERLFYVRGDFGDGREGEAGITNSTEMLATSRFIKGVFNLVYARANNKDTPASKRLKLT